MEMGYEDHKGRRECNIGSESISSVEKPDREKLKLDFCGELGWEYLKIVATNLSIMLHNEKRSQK